MMSEAPGACFPVSRELALIFLLHRGPRADSGAGGVAEAFLLSFGRSLEHAASSSWGMS